jgi:methylmalonyl-CoA/ethylmalonyl-CoA epimerase
MKIDHIGIVVKSIERSVHYWEQTFGYRQMTKVVLNTRQKVKVAFLCKEGSLTIKLIEPSDIDSPVYRFALKGGGLHHLCFKCDILQQEIDRLRAIGLRSLAAPQPGEAFENEPIAFLFGRDGLNIELIDTERKAGRITDNQCVE